MKSHTHRLSRVVAAGLAAGAIASPAANAMPALDPPPQVGEPAPAPVVRPTGERLDWGSAAIGAGGAGALILLASAGGIGYRRRHAYIAVTR